MARRDTQLIEAGDLRAATALLTRLPVGAAPIANRGARAAWAYPAVGAAVTALGALIAWLALPFGPQAAAALGLATTVVATGALHEDGLADSADGLWGGGTRERRLEIMKDSRIGTYGVLALLIVSLLRWTSVAALLTSGGVLAWIAAAAGGRAAMVVLMHSLPHARASGLSTQVGRPALGPTLIAVGTACAAAVALPGNPIWLIATLTAVTLVIHGLAKNKIGGQTGDILGGTALIGETAALLAFAAHIH